MPHPASKPSHAPPPVTSSSHNTIMPDSPSSSMSDVVEDDDDDEAEDEGEMEEEEADVGFLMALTRGRGLAEAEAILARALATSPAGNFADGVDVDDLEVDGDAGLDSGNDEDDEQRFHVETGGLRRMMDRRKGGGVEGRRDRLLMAHLATSVALQEWRAQLRRLAELGTWST